MKKFIFDPRLRLMAILLGIAFHSLCVGIGLIFFSPQIMTHFGFSQYQERFFNIQGGVLHLVMCVAYTLGALEFHKHRGLIFFSITAKYMATVFLFGYYLFADRIWSVLISGFVDCFMGSIILWGYLAYMKERALLKNESLTN